MAHYSGLDVVIPQLSLVFCATGRDCGFVLIRILSSALTTVDFTSSFWIARRDEPSGEALSWREHRYGWFRMNDRLTHDCLIHDHVHRSSLLSCLKSMMLNPV